VFLDFCFGGEMTINWTLRIAIILTASLFLCLSLPATQYLRGQLLIDRLEKVRVLSPRRVEHDQNVLVIVRDHVLERGANHVNHRAEMRARRVLREWEEARGRRRTEEATREIIGTKSGGDSRDNREK
jgi:hypothetical protein